MTQSSPTRPVPTKADLLLRIQRLGLPIAEVVDVGVRDSTFELIEAFPKKRHHLFEPVTLFFGAIERNYRRIDHVLYPIALSDVDTRMHLTVTALQHDGVATHSAIGDKPTPVDGRTVVSCTELQVRRFDSLDDRWTPDFLLKVDVDGPDLLVLKGFGARLALASVVVIEMTYQTYGERSAYLSANGFELFDIVDLVYYGDGLYQFDAAFVRRDLLTEAVRPSIMKFERALWRPLSFG